MSRASARPGSKALGGSLFPLAFLLGVSGAVGGAPAQEHWKRHYQVFRGLRGLEPTAAGEAGEAFEHVFRVDDEEDVLTKLRGREERFRLLGAELELLCEVGAQRREERRAHVLDVVAAA